MSVPAARAAPLLFTSGLCALVYQVAWLRELRLVFGASTAASAAVLAVFMGGLGAGGVVLGRRAERRADPLGLYANLELAVAATAALTPLLVVAARRAYLGLGGAAVLGGPGATLVRLLLAVLVLGGPTFLMGGTLPAAARAVVGAGDLGRRALATLYGLNTLGAVVGAAVANFLLIEVFGDRMTIWLACLLNALVGMFARSVARSAGAPAPSAEPAGDPGPDQAAAAPSLPPSLFWFPPVAAGVAGLAFLLMELVWYRMLGPILGGSSYSFGLILCVALAGIGIGGVLYGRRGLERPATLAGFAWTCGLEAAFIAVPYALGDRLAVLAVMLRPLAGFGFPGSVASWTILATIVVLPAAVVSGYQFPLVIGLFGRGDERVARHVGAAYAANTLGAIAGSLAGGFGLLPALGALGCWRLVVGLLATSGLLTAALTVWSPGRDAPAQPSGVRLRALAPAVVALLAAALIRATGPTAAWRHSPIGAGRSDSLLTGISKNQIEDWIHAQNREVEWEADGVESSVALTSPGGYAFVVNGKIDGNTRSDAGTQVMSGLIGAALSPSPRSAFVIGLGTGSTAGWLAKVPGMERVDVAELEPVILRVARAAEAVNLHVLDDPKVHVTIGDAREVLLTTRARYDLVFSEPSNPYRAGISSLYTRELYEAAARALTPDGVFLQWLQLYDVDGRTVRTAIATLHSVLPSVTVFQTERGDLILMAAAKPVSVEAGALAARLAGEPYRAAMNATWRTDDLEGFLAHHVASPAFADRIAELEGDRLNVDDDNMLEFAFARGVGKGRGLSGSAVLLASRALGADRADFVRGPVDWAKVARRRVPEFDDLGAVTDAAASAEISEVFAAEGAYRSGNLAPALRRWRSGHAKADSVGDRAMYAEALAGAGDEGALPLVEEIRAVRPAEADAILARLRFKQDRLGETAALLASAFHAFRDDPWPLSGPMRRSLDLAGEVVERDPSTAGLLFEAMSARFASAGLEPDRRQALVRLALVARSPRLCADAFAVSEPWPPWNRGQLAARARCYRAARAPLAERAARDLADFDRGAVLPIFDDLRE